MKSITQDRIAQAHNILKLAKNELGDYHDWLVLQILNTPAMLKLVAGSKKMTLRELKTIKNRMINET